MKKITEKEALDLLLQDIKDKKDLTKPENKWILHSIYVGLAARRIAQALDLNESFALKIGYLHDIGRRINHFNHPIEGYFYLKNLGYDDIARYSLTHSFLNNDITKTVGIGPKDKESYDFINNYLQSINKDLFDNIIHLCDLMCLETGFTTIEKRILDVMTRKGVSENSYSHYMDLMDFKSWLEISMKKDLYDLFPEIKKEDLDNRLLDKALLLELIKPKYLTKKK
ncbi:MAG: HD domain-containing protein [Bacilli bacterium]|nr:HD domain-containing protein [Bacilli bacterium]